MSKMTKSSQDISGKYPRSLSVSFLTENVQVSAFDSLMEGWHLGVVSQNNMPVVVFA